MKIIKTKFNGLKIYKKDTYNDKRGYTRELFLNKSLNKDEKRSYKKYRGQGKG